MRIKMDEQIQLRYALTLNLFLEGLFKKMGGRGRGRGGGGRGGISWIKKEEPKFIRDFKERVAYKEQANLESKVCANTSEEAHLVAVFAKGLLYI